MSEQITSKLDNASTNATTCVGSTPAIYKLYESNGITICGGLSYCSYKDKMEKDIRAKVQKEVRDEMFSEHPQPRYGGAFYSLDESGKTTLIYLKKVILTHLQLLLSGVMTRKQFANAIREIGMIPKKAYYFVR